MRATLLFAMPLALLRHDALRRKPRRLRHDFLLMLSMPQRR